ncbi:MAG: diol dehydratase small subunit [Actinomycetales bacterium]|jgi:propanediol dehydratase small subunit
MTTARSGKPASEITLDALRDGQVGIDDVRIHPDTLLHQAAVAERHANPQLAENFRRAAELALLPDEQVMSIYEALRPNRSTHDDLVRIADDLQAVGAVRSAALVREAADAYRGRGLLT